jgi:FkbM family methyltransferase
MSSRLTPQRIWRSLALRVLAPLGIEARFRRNGFLWTGSLQCAITRTIFLSGSYQDAPIADLMPLLDSGRSVLVNLGANIGDIALPLTRTGRRVIAVEPNPETFAKLLRNIRRNGLEGRIEPVPVAISEISGVAQLVIAKQPGNSELAGEAGAIGFAGVDERAGEVSVETKPLSAVLDSLGIDARDVALVWSDTQGFEASVIASGGALWAGGTPLWVEVWPKGLDCHGGTERFLALCAAHFKQFYASGQLRMPPRPVSELPALVATLAAEQTSTDILLMP